MRSWRKKKASASTVTKMWSSNSVMKLHKTSGLFSVKFKYYRRIIPEIIHQLTTWLWSGWSLFVLSLEMKLQAGQGKDHLPIVVVLLRLRGTAAARGTCSFDRIGCNLTLALQYGEAIHSYWMKKYNKNNKICQQKSFPNPPSISLLAKA